MDRCERCGADALNVHGVCRNCGWQRPESGFDDDLSLGETRPADTAIPSGQASFYPRSSEYQPGLYQGQMSGPATAATNIGPRSGPASGAAPRYCGVCGARITGSETFCGQCGSPITAAPTPVGHSTGPGRYQVGPSDWNSEDAEGFTEALIEPPVVTRAPYPNDPYARSFAPAYGVGAKGAAGGLSRSAKITLGALFLGASVLLAIITIALAVVWFSAI